MPETLQPTNTLYFGPMPCEKTAAAIASKVSDDVSKKDTSAVAYRFVQTLYAKSLSDFKIFLCVFAISLNLYYPFTSSRHAEKIKTFDDLENYFISGLTTFLFIAWMLPNIANRCRYAKAEHQCETFLRNKLGDEKFEQVQECGHNKAGMFKLSGILNDAGLPPIPKRQLKKFEK